MMQTKADNPILENWNRMEQATATEVILPCNGSRAWAIGVVNRYPFDTAAALLAAADEVWLGLKSKDWQEAFDSHPRIGEKHAKAATEKSLSWSSGEQDAAKLDEQTQAELAAANREYEAKFGRIFIVCATGRSAAEMLAILRGRLGNDAQTELHEATEQQRQITQLRLRKWLQMPAEAR